MWLGWTDWIVLAAPVLHGVRGPWDEMACLALPLFVAVTLWLMSRKPADADDPPDPAPPEASQEEGH